MKLCVLGAFLAFVSLGMAPVDPDENDARVCELELPLPSSHSPEEIQSAMKELETIIAEYKNKRKDKALIAALQKVRADWGDIRETKLRHIKENREAGLTFRSLKMNLMQTERVNRRLEEKNLHAAASIATTKFHIRQAKRAAAKAKREMSECRREAGRYALQLNRNQQKTDESCHKRDLQIKEIQRKMEEKKQHDAQVNRLMLKLSKNQKELDELVKRSDLDLDPVELSLKQLYAELEM